MQKARKTAAELEAIVRAEAVRVIGPPPDAPKSLAPIGSGSDPPEAQPIERFAYALGPRFDGAWHPVS